MVKHDFAENPLGKLRVTSNRLSKITVDFSCYEYAEKPDGSPYSQSASGMLEIAITNPGNIWTPCIVEITPRAAGASAFTVKGINRNPDTGESLPVTIRNTTKDKTVILDGETGKIVRKQVEAFPLLGNDGDVMPQLAQHIRQTGTDLAAAND